MKVIMFSTDRSAFDENSSFRSRIVEYGALFDELYVVVATPAGFSEIRLGERAHIVPTNSRIKLLILKDYYVIAAKILKDTSQDFIVTSQEEFSGLACALLKMWYGVPWQAQVHSDIFSPYFKKFSFKNAIRTIIARRTLSHATRIRVVSRRIKESIEGRSIRTPIDVLPIFVDVEPLYKIAETRTFSESGFDFVFLIIARLAPEKNAAVAIKAFAEVVKKYPQTTLRIVGDGNLRASLEALAVSLNLGAHVQFEGWQNNISGYFKSADCFLATSWYEGYGMSVVEAMAAKLPIVMTDVGVAGDLVIDNQSGLVVAPGDTTSLTKAMMRMRSGDGEGLREKLGITAHQRALEVLSRQDYLEKFQFYLLQCLRNKN